MSENQGTGPRGPAAPPRRPPPLPPAAGVQRRQHARFDVKLSAELTVGDEVFTATTRDISEGGVGLDLDRSLPEGGELGINLFLVVDDVEDERTPTLKVRGFVAWCAERDEGEWAAGIRFAEVAANQKQWLKQFLEYVAKQ
ncbi:MAG: PilZ domain-containing protein [Deltaproteobacteria bacterium]|nr:PilZ domain-containing protein [Deltaproteobacteria bacterium]